jgi:hypothetical protein
MKKFTFYNIFIIFIFFGFQFYSNAQEQTQQIQDTTQVKNDSLTNKLIQLKHQKQKLTRIMSME